MQNCQNFMIDIWVWSFTSNIWEVICKKHEGGFWEVWNFVCLPISLCREKKQKIAFFSEAPFRGQISTRYLFKVQCGRSSLSQDGGANLRHHFIKKVKTTLNKWMGRPQLLPEIFKIVLQPIWWATGSEQPSPPLHRAAAAQLLTWSGTLLLCISISWLNSICISLWTNHISAQRW